MRGGEEVEKVPTFSNISVVARWLQGGGEERKAARSATTAREGAGIYGERIRCVAPSFKNAAGVIDLPRLS
ncbi:MAG: hypothetical protein WC659_04955 [Patescibacteria group bacterium]